MPQLLYVHRPVDTDSRRIRARFGSGFVRIRGDSRGFALVFGNNEKISPQQIRRIHVILQMQINYSVSTNRRPYQNLIRQTWIALMSMQRMQWQTITHTLMQDSFGHVNLEPSRRASWLFQIIRRWDRHILHLCFKIKHRWCSRRAVSIHSRSPRSRERIKESKLDKVLVLKIFLQTRT